MAQKTAQRQDSQSESGEYVEVTVNFHSHMVTFRIKKGATKKELWEAVKKKAAEEGIEIGDTTNLTISIDLKIVVINELTGTIEEIDEETGARYEVQDEEILGNVVISITENVEGGI